MHSLRRRLLKLALVVLVFIVLSTCIYRLLGLAYGRDWTMFDCLYFTVVSVTTTGFGELLADFEQFRLARAFTMIVMLFGAGTLAYAVSTITAFVVEGHLSDFLERKKMLKQIAKLRDHFIICGADETARHVIAELLKTHRDFVVIERDEKTLDGLQELGEFLHVHGDPTDDAALTAAGIQVAKAIAIALPNDKDNLFIAFTARQLNPSIRIISRMTDPAIGPKLARAGADKAVSPNFIGGMRMVSEMIRPTVVSFLDVMLRDVQSPYRIEEATIQPGSPLIGQTLGQAGLKDCTGALPLAARKPGETTFLYNPPADLSLVAGMSLVVLANVDQLKKLKELSSEAKPEATPEAAPTSRS